jgi:hypothetical protein
MVSVLWQLYRNSAAVSVLWQLYRYSAAVSVLWQLYRYSAAVPKVRSVDPLGSTTSSHGIRGYIYVMATLKFT